MASNRSVIHAHIVIESSVEGQDRTTGYVVSALKNACKNIRDGTVLITLYDEKEHLIGADMSGTPSEELQESFEDLVDKLGEGPIRVTPRPSPPPGR